MRRTPLRPRPVRPAWGGLRVGASRGKGERVGKIKEFLALMFTGASKEPTVGKLAEVAEKLPQVDSLEALYLGAETFGVADPKGKVLGIIDNALAFIKTGLQKLREDIATARQDMAAVAERCEREIQVAIGRRDEKLAYLRGLSTGYDYRLTELEAELDKLAALRKVFAGEESDA